MHFIPTVVIIFLMRDVYLEPDGLIRMEIFADQFFPRFLYYNYAIAFHASLYAIICLVTMKKIFPRLAIEEKVYLALVSTIYLLSALLLSVFVEYANNWRDFAPYYLCVSLFFLLVGFLLYRNPKFLSNLGSKYLSSTISKEEMIRIVNRMRGLAEDEQIFLNKNLSIGEVALKLNVPSYKISQTLSTELKTNFNEFLNEYRVKHSIKMFENPDFSHYKIEAIAFDSGFNNKVTFYKAFSRLYNETPASFRKSLSSKEKFNLTS